MSVETLQPLAGLSQLQELRLLHVKVRDRCLEPLCHLVRLEELCLGNLYPSHEVARLVGRLPRTRCNLFRAHFPTNIPCSQCGAAKVGPGCHRAGPTRPGLQARFATPQVSIAGQARPYVRVGDSGNSVNMHFCPHCGSTVYWQFPDSPEFMIVAVGAFADPTFPAPKISIYKTRRHPWTAPFQSTGTSELRV